MCVCVREFSKTAKRMPTYKLPKKKQNTANSIFF